MRAKSSALTSCAVAAAVVVLLSGIAQAQRYDTIPAKLSERASKQEIGGVSNVLRANNLTDAGKQQLDLYFKGYYFPTMTEYEDPEQLAEVADMREEYFTRYVNRTNSAEVRDYLIDMARSAMSSIALGNFHPAVRYNAVLLIGSLDKEAAGGGNNAKPPVPLPAASNVLLALLERDEIKIRDKTVEVPASVKAGALVGLERHARFGVDPALAERTTKAALDIVQQVEAKEGMDQDVHDWMRCMAAQVLASQYAAGPDQTVQDAFNSLIDEKDMSLDDRCRVARMLKSMKYEGVANLDVSATTIALADLTDDVITRETDLAREFQKKLLGDGRGGGGFGRGGGRGGYEGGYGGGGRSGGRGGFGGASRDDQAQYLTRRLLDRLTALRDAMRQLNGASPEVKEQLAPLYDPIRALIAAAVDKDADEVTTARMVIESSKEITNAAIALRPAAAEEPADDGFPAPAEDAGAAEAEPAETATDEAADDEATAEPAAAEATE